MNAITRTRNLALCSAFLMSGLFAQEATGDVPAAGDVSETGDVRTPSDAQPQSQQALARQAQADERQANQHPIQAAPQANLSQSMTDEGIELSVSRLTDPVDPFLGVILVSFESTTARFIGNAAPLLRRHAVLAAGFATGDYTYMLDRRRLPVSLPVHVQGLVFDGDGIKVSAVQLLGSGCFDG